MLSNYLKIYVPILKFTIVKYAHTKNFDTVVMAKTNKINPLDIKLLDKNPRELIYKYKKITSKCYHYIKIFF